MDDLKMKDLTEILSVSRAVEACQTAKLITPEERKDYFAILAVKAKEAIDILFA